MRFKRILHPEVVLGRRGSEEATSIYKLVRDVVTYDEKVKAWAVVGLPLQNMVNEVMMDHFTLVRKFQMDPEHRVFHIGKDFAEALMRFDREIPVEYLPEHFLGFISFPRETIYDEKDEVFGAYVYVGPRQGSSLKPSCEADRKTKVFWVSLVESMHEDGSTGAVQRLAVDCVPGKVSEWFRNAGSCGDYYGMTQDAEVSKEYSEDALRKREVIFRLLMNTVLYIHSLDAELLKVRAESSLSRSQRIALERRGEGEFTDCTLPITLVNHNYHEKKEFSVDSTWVTTHPRWQPCGPKLSQVKLVWVRGHERVYREKENHYVRRQNPVDGKRSCPGKTYGCV